MAGRRLIVVVGQEGAGKSTLIRALLLAISNSAQIDAEDVGQVNPWVMDDTFVRLQHGNVAALAENFWTAGYRTVISGSHVSTHADLRAFLTLVADPVDVYVIQLLASVGVRDQRRIQRAKPTSEALRLMVDTADPEDHTLAQYHGYDFLRVDTDHVSVDDVVNQSRLAFPELFAGSERHR